MKSGNHFEITPQVKDYLDGLLLGDGSIVKSGNVSALYILNQKSDHLDWIEKQISFFTENGIRCKTYIRPSSQFEMNGKIYHRKEQIRLHTSTYRNFLDVRNRWYPLSKKIVPRDINIRNPILLANWYMGDGSVIRNRNILYISLSTDGFEKDDVDFLSLKLKEIEMDSVVRLNRNKPTLYIKYWHASKFLEMIKDHVVPSFQYKLPTDFWQTPKCQICSVELNKRSYAKFCDVHAKEQKIAQDKAYYQMYKNIKVKDRKNGN